MNSWGRLFRVQLWGTSHGARMGVVLDGVAAGMRIQETDFDEDIQRRKPMGRGTTARVEADECHIESGVFEGYTTGAPLSIVCKNENVRSGDYKAFRSVPRPGHADWVATHKFRGFEDYRGGGFFSGRLTLPLVAAGVVAKKMIAPMCVAADLVEMGGSTDIAAARAAAVANGDSVGGLVACRVEGVPMGLGEPFFESVESVISHAIFAIPSVKAIGFGSGVKAKNMRGSQHNDAFLDETGRTETNFSGGINGGITNGNPLYFEVTIKPASSTPYLQHSYNKEKGQVASFHVQGRHDLCIPLRVPVVVEALTAIALADLLLMEKGKNGIQNAAAVKKEENS